MIKTSNQTMAEAWLAATHSGEWKDAENFAKTLMGECRIRVPRLGGILAGAEDEVIQDMCLLLVGSFLPRNRRLAAATSREDHREIEHHLRASVRICGVHALRRIARYRAREYSRKGEPATDAEFGAVDHPHASRELSPAERCALALSAMQLALRKDMLSERAAEIVRLTLVEGLTGREVADRLGISPSAVSQQLQRVSAQLRILKEEIEITTK